MGIKIKVTPRKSDRLCSKCVNGYYNRCQEYLFNLDSPCEGCPVYFGDPEECLCFVIKKGEPCPFFERYEK